MNVLIISSSSEDIDSYYTSIARSVSNFLARSDYNLIFVGSTKSMMGTCYDEFKKQEKTIYAFSTQKYKDELNRLTYAKRILCDTTFDMKKAMFDLADLIVCLPGGIGTISEILSFIEEIRSNNIDKKMIIYDENNYYEELINYLKENVKKGFISPEILSTFSIARNKDEFVDRMHFQEEGRVKYGK